MAPATLKKRKIDDGVRRGTERPKKKSRKQIEYHSSSEDEDANEEQFAPVNLQDSDAEDHEQLEDEVADIGSENDEEVSSSADEGDSEQSDASDSEGSLSDSAEATNAQRKKVSKRNDPTAFSTSISKILSTKLPTSARSDPLLTRSKSTTQATSELANEKLEKRARAKLRAEKKAELERGRVKDVLGVERGEAGETAEQEKRLRKIAQRGVVKLFNAVRAAQVRGEELAREERRNRTTVGMGEREKAVNEVSKQGFLDLINGKGGKKLNIEEA